ncbi:MAG: hypothetical protein KAT91_01400 [Candidatus Aenigmarchaeota archaeon]|nr:hypothetical protein [Candidatus Aenigmarchaeota archaeon]
MSKNSIFSTSIIFAMVIFSGFVFAEDAVEIKISSKTDATFPGEPIKYTAVISNNYTTDLNSTIFIEGADKSAWITLSQHDVYLNTRETKSVDFYITPTYGTAPDNYPFEFKVETDAGVSTKKFVVYVMRRAELELTIIRSEKEEYEPGEPVTIIAGVKNIGTLDSGVVSVDIGVTGTNANKTDTIDLGTISIKKENTGSKEFSFDKYTTKGLYVVSATAYNDLGETIGKNTTTFTITEKEIFNTKESTDSNIFYKTVVIEGRNTGNSEGVLKISRPLFGFDWLYVFTEEPKRSFETGDKEYVWECTLMPNETCTVEYKVNYWMYYVIAILLIALFSIILAELERPHIVKKNYKKGIEHAIHIEIKNRSKKELKSVTVKDFIPTVLQFVERKDTLKPTTKRKHKNGTEIIWKLGQLNPGEERVVSYRIKPLLDVVGGIELPEAEITAVDKKGKKYTGISAKVSMD